VIRIDQVVTFTGVDVKTWLVGTDLFWAVDKSGLSTFSFQGFKNIDVYGVDVIGNVQTSASSVTSGCVANTWAFEIQLNGQLPLTSGLATGTNFWNLQSEGNLAKQFALSNYTNSLKFADPIKSVQNIEFLSLTSQGVGAETAGSIVLDYDLSFIVYYRYEGE
jgi:hypothetical protein